MKALVYEGPGKKDWEEVPDSQIQQPTDVIVPMVATTICGTDLHILKGDVPAVTEGRILGHEGIGVVTEAAEGISNLAVGDRVILLRERVRPLQPRRESPCSREGVRRDRHRQLRRGGLEAACHRPDRRPGRERLHGGRGNSRHVHRRD